MAFVRVAAARLRFQGRHAADAPRSLPQRRTSPRSSASTVCVTPQVTGDETFFDALFAGSGTSFADVKAKAEKGEPQTALTIAAKVTITIDQTYEVISQQTTHNVVGVIEGSDARLKDTYVLFGAHLDHLGYSQTGGSRGAGPKLPPSQPRCTGRRDGGREDGPASDARSRRWRAERGGAARGAPVRRRRRLLSISATSSATAPTMTARDRRRCWQSPRRSPPDRVRSVRLSSSGMPARRTGLYGSRFNADFPIVPLDRIQTELNIDMVGRDDCDNIEGDYSNTLFIVGADRISTDLHNVIVETNRGMRVAADARLRAQRSAGSGERLHAQRPFQLRVEGHSGRVLHDRPAPGLSPRRRTPSTRSGSTRWRDRAAGVSDRVRDREQRRHADARQQGVADRIRIEGGGHHVGTR